MYKIDMKGPHLLVGDEDAASIFAEVFSLNRVRCFDMKLLKSLRDQNYDVYQMAAVAQIRDHRYDGNEVMVWSDPIQSLPLSVVEYVSGIVQVAWYPAPKMLTVNWVKNRHNDFNAMTLILS